MYASQLVWYIEYKTLTTGRVQRVVKGPVVYKDYARKRPVDNAKVDWSEAYSSRKAAADEKQKLDELERKAFRGIGDDW